MFVYEPLWCYCQNMMMMMMTRRYLKTMTDGADVTWAGRSFCVLPLETGKTRLPTVER